MQIYLIRQLFAMQTSEKR